MSAASEAANDVLALVRTGKEALVKARGVGEDLIPSLIGWYGGEAATVARLTDRQPFGSIAVAIGAIALRANWGAEAVSYVLEGYAVGHETDEDYTTRFANGDKDVTECIVVHHFTPTGSASVQQSYLYGLRTVEWGGIEPITRLNPFLHMVGQAIEADAGAGTANLMKLLGFSITGGTA